MARQDFEAPSDLIQLATRQGQAHVQALQSDTRQLMGLLANTMVGMTKAFEAVEANPDRATLQSALRHIITNLQFHDLAAQIGARVDLRLEGIASMLDMVAAHSVSQTLPRISQIEAHNESLLRQLRRSVEQTDLRPGTVELF